MSERNKSLFVRRGLICPVTGVTVDHCRWKSGTQIALQMSDVGRLPFSLNANCFVARQTGWLGESGAWVDGAVVRIGVDH